VASCTADRIVFGDLHALKLREEEEVREERKVRER
jgi:hypothetical protein